MGQELPSDSGGFEGPFRQQGQLLGMAQNETLSAALNQEGAKVIRERQLSGGDCEFQ